jgi:aspartate kinase
MFKVLAEQEVAIKMVSTSEIAVSAVVPEETMVKAVEALHAYFDLDAKEKEKIEAVKA